MRWHWGLGIVVLLYCYMVVFSYARWRDPTRPLLILPPEGEEIPDSRPSRPMCALMALVWWWPLCFVLGMLLWEELGLLIKKLRA